jgi:hypothetical protein
VASIRISGGAALEAKLAELASNLGSGRAEVRVGFLEGARYPDGTPVATIAAIQNFGAPSRGIPPRPFFSSMIEAKSPGWGDSFVGVLKAANYDVGLSLARFGEGIAGQLRQSIRDTNAPPLAQATIDRKGFAKPLIDTGVMFNSVGVEVVGGGK